MHKRMSPHGDFDHMGEAINLVNNFKVEKVIFNCGSYNDLEKELIKVLDKKHIKYYSCISELNIDDFLRQLGIGFTYVGNEYKIRLGDKYNYIDLLLYNIKYKCLCRKVTKLKKEHTGQIMIYMNYIDESFKTIEENDTVGIIICKQDNKYVIKYCSDDRIIAREYELV